MEVEKENQTEEMALEDMLLLLNEQVKQLEAEDITLEESFRVYEKGMKLIQKCNDKIDNVEKKVLQMNEDGSLSEMG